MANLLAGILIENREIKIINKTINGGIVEIGVGEKVGIFIKRVRWYGTIRESEKISNLKLFNIVNIPVRVNNSSWVLYHFITLALLIIFIKIQLKKEEEKWESNLDGEFLFYS